MASSTNPSSQQMAFFKLTFTGSVHRDFFCPICKELMKKPRHTSCCRSRCCKECIGRIQLISNPCPKCSRRGFSVQQDEVDVKLQEKIDGLIVYCPMQNYGCKWKGKLGTLDQHIKLGNSSTSTDLCQVVSISCTNGCGKFVPRGELTTHLQSSCPKRIMSCDYCGHEDTYEQLSAVHYSICHKFPVSCSLGCNMAGVTRSTIQEHQEKRCPQRVVSCEYKSVGCNVDFKFAEGHSHMEEYTKKHLSYVCSYAVKLQEENSKLQTTCARLVEDCSTLRTMYDKLSANFGQLAAQVDSLRLSIPCPLPPSRSNVASEPRGLGPGLGRGGGEPKRPDLFPKRATKPDVSRKPFVLPKPPPRGSSATVERGHSGRVGAVGGGTRKLNLARKTSVPLPAQFPILKEKNIDDCDSDDSDYLFMDTVPSANRPHPPLQAAKSTPNISSSPGPPLPPKPPQDRSSKVEDVSPKLSDDSRLILARSYSPLDVYPQENKPGRSVPSFVSPPPPLSRSSTESERYCTSHAKFEDISSPSPLSKSPPVQFNLQMSSSSSESVSEGVLVQ